MDGVETGAEKTGMAGRASGQEPGLTLYPEIEPYRSFYFPVPGGHELYVEECGNPNGQPALFLHGGPGAGCSPKHRRYFDPDHYRIILFDQRGAGRSKPFASLNQNTTWDLVEDIERIRKHLNIDRWLVFGGSWGSTLALAYAETHPKQVTHLVLRGIFMCRDSEIKWFYQEGAHWIFPDEFERYQAVIPVEERGDFLKAFYRRLTSDDASVRTAAARAWSGWEGATVHLIPEAETFKKFTSDSMAEALARIECHYFVNKCWWDQDDHLLQNIDRIRNQAIPATIIHGRYDVVCPVKNAFDLSAVWPEAELKIIPDAGHAVDEPGILSALIEATNQYRLRMIAR